MNMIRTALITGAARRIGKRMAMDLASQGWAVAIHYNSSRDEAQAVARRHCGRRGPRCHRAG
jgi:NAD(P)-dependent dehydrogenase (short-subunit alcohol dehydrogenase family)